MPVRTPTWPTERRLLEPGWSKWLSGSNDLSLPKNLLHRLSFCEFVNQLVQIANFLFQRVIDCFHTNAADYTLDQRAVWVKAGCLVKESLEIAFVFDLLLQPCFIVASKPAYDLVDFLLVSVL